MVDMGYFDELQPITWWDVGAAFAFSLICLYVSIHTDILLLTTTLFTSSITLFVVGAILLYAKLRDKLRGE